MSRRTSVELVLAVVRGQEVAHVARRTTASERAPPRAGGAAPPDDGQSVELILSGETSLRGCSRARPGPRLEALDGQPT